MDIKSFITFRTIVKEGSFSKAAQKLGYTQSTVTFQMQQLEQELSIKLFEKIGRTMKPTQAGKEILPNVEEMMVSLQKIREAGNRDGQISGELNVAMAETLMSYKMQEVLRRFKEAAPDVKLSLRSLNCYVIRDCITDGSADVGVFYDVGGFRDTINVRRLRSYKLAVVSSPSLAEELRDFNTSGSTIHTSFIINEPDCVFREIFEDYLKEKNIHLDNTIELWSIETIKRSVASNLGISYLPRFTVEKELSEGTLVELKAGCTDTEIMSLYAYHKNKWISPALKLFMGFVNEHLGMR